MKKFALALVVGLLPTTMAFGQQPSERPAPESPSAPYTGRMISPGETQEMWFYEQERRRSEDPQALVRANAQQRAAERHARLAAMAWFGMSNSRPKPIPTRFTAPIRPIGFPTAINRRNGSAWAAPPRSSCKPTAEPAATKYR